MTHKIQMRLVPALILAAAGLSLIACSNPGPAETAGTVAYRYACESGRTATVQYPDSNSAQLDYDGRQRDLTLAVSASGARYTGGQLEWWTKGSGAGSTASIFEHGPQGRSGKLLDSCTAL